MHSRRVQSGNGEPFELQSAARGFRLIQEAERRREQGHFVGTDLEIDQDLTPESAAFG
jgi:hypothetical protein